MMATRLLSRTYSGRAPVFARVITAQVACDRVDSAIRAAQVQLPDAQRQHGFVGFYLLADREAGKLLTLSLWDSYDDVLAAEAHAAQLRSQTARSLAVAAPAVGIYEVAVQA